MFGEQTFAQLKSGLTRTEVALKVASQFNVSQHSSAKTTTTTMEGGCGVCVGVGGPGRSCYKHKGEKHFMETRRPFEKLFPLFFETAAHSS